MPSANRVVRRQLTTIVVLFALFAAACADPLENVAPPPPSPTPVPEVVPDVDDPEPDPTPSPTPSPTATPVVTPEPPDTTPEPDVTPSPSPTPVPGAEPGLTDEVIRVGVVADINTGGIVDLLHLTSVQATLAWADTVNSEGGLAGRQVEVEVFDTGLFEHRAALVEACEGNVFALVGSAALLDDDGVELLSDPDCFLPDFIGTPSSPIRTVSPMTYASNPYPHDIVHVGSARYFAEFFPDLAASSSSVFLDFELTQINGEKMLEAATAQGFAFPYLPVVSFDEPYLAIADVMDRQEIESMVWVSDRERLFRMAAALDVNNNDLGFIDCGTGCYSRLTAETIVDTDAPIWAWTPFLPFEEVAESPEMARYLFALGGVSADAVADIDGLSAWAAGRLFEEAVNRAVEAAGEDGELTRQGVLDAASTITNWDAHGLHGESNPAARNPSACFVMLRLVEGEWLRVLPFGAGEFDCRAENLFRLERTAVLGLETDTVADASAADDNGEAGADGEPDEGTSLGG